MGFSYKRNHKSLSVKNRIKGRYQVRGDRSFSRRKEARRRQEGRKGEEGTEVHSAHTPAPRGVSTVHCKTDSQKHRLKTKTHSEEHWLWPHCGRAGGTCSPEARAGRVGLLSPLPTGPPLCFAGRPGCSAHRISVPAPSVPGDNAGRRCGLHTGHCLLGPSSPAGPRSPRLTASQHCRRDPEPLSSRPTLGSGLRISGCSHLSPRASTPSRQDEGPATPPAPDSESALST